MLQCTAHPSPFAFADGRKKPSSSSTPRFLSNDSLKHDPSRRPALPSAAGMTLAHRLTAETDSSVDRLSSLSVSTSFSSLPSPSFPSASLPRAVPRSSNGTALPPSSPSKQSFHSSHIEDILSHGDIVGEGILLQGEPLRFVPNPSADQNPLVDYLEPATEFEVVRKLGTGSYAVVYLVREVLSRSPPSEDDHFYPSGRLELDDGPAQRPPTEYGREYAIKLLSKADLNEEDLVAQLTEATIHQSLPAHPNIVTLHRTLETPAFLLLLLEFVPGQDLFYFLEQARDHYDADPAAAAADPALSHTPPTPGLLSSLHPSQLLSHTRLRLIASMFSQMCEAVAVCHDTSVFHRDIKPENFIVTDAWPLNADGIRERKVVVKLSDFGLSTRDAVSSDMDCGSAPYMSFECRNNVAPIYKPRAADVWSLGIVLINMLYHYNPWTDTATGGCPSFDLYLRNPTEFFMHRFAGMTLPVANFLVENVFCILDDPTDDSQRIGAREFGLWVRDLPALLGAPQSAAIRTHSRVSSTASAAGLYLLGSAPPSRRPSSRQASVAGGSPRRPSVVLRSLSRNTSLGPARDAPPALNEEDEDEEQQAQNDGGRSPSMRSTTSTTRRTRKRGRKGKGATPTSDQAQTSDLLASASQTLARELSRATRSASASVQSFPDMPPPPVPVATVTKKPSKWKLSFGKSSGEAASNAQSGGSGSGSGSSRATNVTNLIMGLSAPNAVAGTSPTSPSTSSPPSPAVPALETPPRGRGGAAAPEPQPRRGASPTSTRSGRPLASSASSWRSSMASTNTSTSAFTRYSNTSARSVSTYATTASASSSSAASSTNWRKHASPSSASLASSAYSFHSTTPPVRAPPNVKLMNGVPWELSGAPRQLHQIEADIFGSPPAPRERKRAARKGKAPAKGGGLEPINERPAAQYRQDAATSTTDLAAVPADADGGEAPKVPKAQINALAKMLSALRR
ncbi:hypothetical protein BC834DRAFT_872193 [Gloeopeniophorella convolvens]|nr:hypothetical protein BC834DRAFT_872193 [Gloeopeniophorella convolvens]